MLVSGAYLLVDGYNVLNSGKIFERLINEDLSHARDVFADMLANYCAFRGCRPVLVFDAYAVKGPAEIEERPGLQLVFTDEGETADSYIEKTAYSLLKDGHKVFVVTGDHSEQLAILGMGAYRLTAGELLTDCQKVSREIAAREEAGKPLAGRQEVAQRLGADVLHKLEDWRRES